MVWGHVEVEVMLACCPPYGLCTAGEMQKLSQVADSVPKVVVCS